MYKLYSLVETITPASKVATEYNKRKSKRRRHKHAPQVRGKLAQSRQCTLLKKRSMSYVFNYFKRVLSINCAPELQDCRHTTRTTREHRHRCAAANFLLSPLSIEPAPSREQIRVLAGPYTENQNCLGSRVFHRGCRSGAKSFRTVVIHSGLCPLNRCSLPHDRRQTDLWCAGDSQSQTLEWRFHQLIRSPCAVALRTRYGTSGYLWQRAQGPKCAN